MLGYNEYGGGLMLILTSDKLSRVISAISIVVFSCEFKFKLLLEIYETELISSFGVIALDNVSDDEALASLLSFLSTISLLSFWVS